MIELHNCDCIEYMKTCKDNQFDLAIVDPPYGISVTKMNMGGRKTVKPDKSKKGFKDKLAMYQTITGESTLQPLRDLIDGPPQVNMEVPDLASEVRNRVEMQKQQIASAPKMYPMYYERAKKGKFIKVKTKLGRNRKTKIL